MSFQTGFNGSTNSSAFPCSVTNGQTSEVAHDPRANRGGAGGVLKMTTHISRVLGKTAPMYNALPEQWYGAATNCAIAPAYNDTIAPQYADGAYGPLLNRFSGTLSLPAIPAAGAAGTNKIFYLGLYGVPVYNATDFKGCLPTIPVTFLEASTTGYVLQVNNARLTFKSSLDVTAGVTGAGNNQILQVDGVTPWPYNNAGGAKTWSLLDYYTVPAIVGPPAYNAATLPALAISVTSDIAAGTDFPAQTITWSLELLPPAQWGAGFAQLDGNGSGGAGVGYNRP